MQKLSQYHREGFLKQ